MDLYHIWIDFDDKIVVEAYYIDYMVFEYPSSTRSLSGVLGGDDFKLVVI